jgi:twitching motility protein PilT
MLIKTIKLSNDIKRAAMNSDRVRNLSREGKTHQIKSQMLSGTDEFSSLEASLAKLYQSGLIKYEDGLFFSENKQFFKDSTKPV